jgi:hypothetical protein
MVRWPVMLHGRRIAAGFAPSAPASGSSGVGAGGAAGGLGAGGCVALLVALLVWCAARWSRPYRFSLALWRPLAFVSIQQRPG